MESDVVGEVPKELLGEVVENDNPVDMNMIVGTHDILFVVLDTLRYDVAYEEQEKGTTPILNRYGKWIACGAPGNFTYPSHHAMFAGFLPIPLKTKSLFKQETLFFPKNIGLGRQGPAKSYPFEGATIMEGLEKIGYETICIGGVSFFDKRSDIGKVFPSMFHNSYWRPLFGCTTKESVDHQIDFAIKKLEEVEAAKHTFMFINISAIHYPNYFYVEGEKQDSKRTHAAALRYVDTRLEAIFSASKKRNPTFVIICSDHGTCYGEDGFLFHGFHHEMVNTVPYKHFIL